MKAMRTFAFAGAAAIIIVAGAHFLGSSEVRVATQVSPVSPTGANDIGPVDRVDGPVPGRAVDGAGLANLAGSPDSTGSAGEEQGGTKGMSVGHPEVTVQIDELNRKVACLEISPTRRDKLESAVGSASGSELVRIEAELEQISKCGEHSLAGAEEALKRVAHLADQGSDEAGIAYYLAGMQLYAQDEYHFQSEKVTAFKRKAVSLLERADASGNADAAFRLYEIHDAGLLVERDPVRALDYFRSWMERRGGSAPQWSQSVIDGLEREIDGSPQLIGRQ